MPSSTRGLFDCGDAKDFRPSEPVAIPSFLRRKDVVMEAQRAGQWRRVNASYTRLNSPAGASRSVGLLVLIVIGIKITPKEEQLPCEHLT